MYGFTSERGNWLAWNSYMQKLRDIVTTGAVKGKHFFLETDMKGPMLKLDNTGKAILTVSNICFLYFINEQHFYAPLILHQN